MKVEKWQSRIFEENSWFGEIREKVSKLAQNQTLWYVSKDFFGFWPEVGTKYDLQVEWNPFISKIWNLEIFDLEIVKKLPKLSFWSFSRLYIIRHIQA